MPRITAPVSRLLAVSDLNRSAAFYREVLGFEVTPAGEVGATRGLDVVSGPARIQLSVGEAALDSTGESRPRGAAVLYLETDDVGAMHAGIVSRGGNPSTVEKANWIKMRVFQIHDPDGHTLWFAQSYQEPALDRPPPMSLKGLPELPLDDVPAGVAHYRDVLGFSINYAQGDLGVMDRDEVTVVLIARTEQHRGIGSCYVYIRDADALHGELLSRGADVLDTPTSMPWGLRQFRVRDREGNRLTFGQPFE